MRLELSVPSYDDEVYDDSALTFTTMKAWLASVTDASLDTLLSHSKQVHRLNCNDAERMELLEWFRPMVTRIGVKLRHRLAESQLPLQGGLIEDMGKLADQHRILAGVYMQVLINSSVEFMNNVEVSEYNRVEQLQQLVLACYGAINHLAEQLQAVYESYKPAPRGVWLDVHHIYQFAHFIIYPDTTADEVGRTGTDEFFMIEHVYKRALLLGLCNPFHFSFKHFHELHRTLNGRASMCSILFDSVSADKHGLFSIDFDSDYPAAPVLGRNDKMMLGENYAVLDTRELVASLNQEIDMVANEAYAEHNENRRSEDLTKIEMLRRLVMNWGQHPVRRDQRNDVILGRRQVTMGFESIVEHTSSSGLLTMMHMFEDDPVNELNCEIIDSSSMGFQLAFDADGDTGFRIGEMLALRTEPDRDDWSLGIVRWARYLSKDRVGMGVFVLGTGWRRIQLHDLSEGGAQGILGLRLTRSISLPVDRKLIIASLKMYRPDIELKMVDEHTQTIVAGSMLMTGADFVVFDYKNGT